jgi:hypothetical protein
MLVKVLPPLFLAFLLLMERGVGAGAKGLALLRLRPRPRRQVRGPYVYEPPPGALELRGTERIGRRGARQGGGGEEKQGGGAGQEIRVVSSVLQRRAAGAAALRIRRVVLRPLRRVLRMLSRVVLRLGRPRRRRPAQAQLGRIRMPRDCQWMLDELQSQVTPELRRRAQVVDHPLDEDQLVRFIEGNHWSLVQRGAPLVQHIERSMAWRESYGAHRIQRGDLPKALPMWVSGRDRLNRPIIWIDLEALFGDGGVDDEEFLRMSVFTLEQAWREAREVSATSYTVVLNCQGFGLSRMPPLRPMKKFAVLLMDYYPMRLGDIIVLNVSSVTLCAWRLVSGLVPSRTKDKMHFTRKALRQSSSSPAVSHELGKFMTPQNIPVSLGGSMEIDKTSLVG